MAFKPISKTVVTEISSFIVDSVSKIGLYKQTVSSKIKTESQLNKIDFNVSKTLSHKIDNPSSIIGISTPEPVKVSLISTGSPIEPVPPEEPVVHHTAQLFVPNTLVAGNMLPITIVDPDIADGVVSIGVVLYNETTGETESIPLVRRIDKSFFGNAYTSNSKTPGVNFDSVMYCLLGQRLRVIYSDPLTANHNRGNVVAYVDVLSPTSTAIVNSRSAVHFGKPIPIEILDKDLNADSVSVDLVNITKSVVVHVTANRKSPGRFTTSVKTDVYDELHPMDNAEVMYVSVGDQIQVVYTDNLDINGEVSIITADVEIVAHTTTVSTLIVTDELVLGDDLEFEVHDYAHVGEQITITLSNVLSDEYRIILLEETVVGTGVFVGSVATSVSYDVDNDVTTVKPGEYLKVVYVDNNNNVFTTLSKNIHTVAPPIVEPPEEEEEEEEPETPDDESEEAVVTGTVELLVNGSFFLNGSFKGSVLVEGLNDTFTRCSLIAS